MDGVLLVVLRFAGPAVLVVAVWAAWERRITLGSRIDRGGTLAILLFGLGSALVSPWHEIAEASHWLTGRYYVLTALGHLCFVVGAALVVKNVYSRLLPDAALRVVARKWLGPFVISVCMVMVVCFVASSTPAALTTDMHLAKPDGWLICYWVAHYSTTTLLGIVAGYGVWRLRNDPRSVLLGLGVATLLAAALSGGALGGYAMVTGTMETLKLVAWLVTYGAFAASFVVAVGQWRHRVRTLVGDGLTQSGSPGGL